MRLIELIVATVRLQWQYFAEGKEEIAAENLVTMQIAGAVGAVVSGIFFLTAPVIIPTWTITKEYILIVPILAAAFFFSFFYSRRKAKPDPRVVEVASAIFYVLLLADFIALSVFPYPNTPQIFISLCFMFMPALMIQRPSVLLGIMAVAELVFILLALQYKTAFSIENDIFNTMAALIFSLIIMITTNRLRCRNFFARTKLQRLSQTDALTCLLNKKAFEERAAAYLADRDPAAGCSLLVLDLDDFKLVNDNFGHPFGDRLLEASGDILLRTFRQSDLVGRIGGDEFAVMMRNSNDPALLTEKSNLLCDRFATLTIDGVVFHTTCSVGVAMLAPGRNTTYAELFRVADEALYHVKRQGKGKTNIKHFH